MPHRLAAEHLPRHLPPQGLLLGQIDVGHRAASLTTQESISPEASPGEVIWMDRGWLRL